MRPHTTATGVVVERGRVAAVETDDGTIATRVVVDAAGAWARRVGAAAGLDVPLVPLTPPAVRHRAAPGRRPPPADGADHERRGLRRPWDGGLLWGVFEDDPLAVDVESLEADFDMGALGLDADVLWRAVADVERQLPILRELPLRSISPAIGEELAAWIVDGAPTRDLSPLAPGRFAAAAPPPEALERDAVWQYRHFYGSA